MRRRGSDQVGRWPWGVWLALVGVSAGTVASFTAVGWAFMSAAGVYDAAGSASPPDWNSESLVIEGEAHAEPDDEDTAEDPGPVRVSPEAPVPEVSPLEPTPEPEARPEPRPEASAVPEPEATEDPRLVPVEEHRECPDEEGGGATDPGGDEATPGGDWTLEPVPILDLILDPLPVERPRSKG